MEDVVRMLADTANNPEVEAKFRVDAAMIVVAHLSKYQLRPTSPDKVDPLIAEMKEVLRILALDEEASMEARLRAAMVIL